MAKKTAEERQAARETERAAAKAAADAKRVEEFRSGFLRKQARKVYSSHLAWQEGEGGNRLAMEVYQVVDEALRYRGKVLAGLDNMRRDAHDAIIRFESNSTPWHSDCIAYRYAELDRDMLSWKLLREQALRLAYALGWRVRELEEARERDLWDMLASVRVERLPDDTCLVMRTNAGNDEVLQSDGEVTAFAPEATSTPVRFATFDLAWKAVSVLAGNRSLE